MNINGQNINDLEESKLSFYNAKILFKLKKMKPIGKAKYDDIDILLLDTTLNSTPKFYINTKVMHRLILQTSGQWVVNNIVYLPIAFSHIWMDDNASKLEFSNVAWLGPTPDDENITQIIEDVMKIIATSGSSQIRTIKFNFDNPNNNFAVC